METLSIELVSLLYFAMMTPPLVAGLYWFACKPDYLRLISGILALTSSSLFLAVILSLPSWNPLRAARLLCIGWFAIVPAFLLFSCWNARARSLRLFALTLILIVVGNGVFAFHVEPYRLEVSRYRVASPKIDRPIRVALLADFQTDKFEEYEKNALRTLMAEKPDAIFMAGDYLQVDSAARWEELRDEVRAFLREIKFGAPLGVFGVGGNTDFHRWPEIFAAFDCKSFIATDMVTLPEFQVVGLSVEDSFSGEQLVADESFTGRADLFRIMLGHAPDFSLSEQLEADLMLAGHTHGGQVRVPGFGPIVTFSRVPRAWAAGRTNIESGKTLIVSRGVGMERRDAPRLRYLCRPELIMIDLVPQ